MNRPGELTLSVLDDELLEISNDGGLKNMFETTSNLHTLWIQVKAEYPKITTKTLKHLLPSPTSYLCKAFAAATATRTKLWSTLYISSILPESVTFSISECYMVGKYKQDRDVLQGQRNRQMKGTPISQIWNDLSFKINDDDVRL